MVTAWKFKDIYTIETQVRHDKYTLRTIFFSENFMEAIDEILRDDWVLILKMY